MSRWRSAFIAALMIAPAAALAAQQRGRGETGSQCAPYSTPVKLNFRTLSTTPKYNHRLNVTGIANLLRAERQALPPPHRTALGITLTQTQFSLRGSSNGIKRGSGYCVYLTSVTVEFGWKSIEVYVPSEFPEGSCEYRAILDHENQHVAINRAVQREFAPQLRQTIEERLRSLTPVRTASAQAGADQAVDEVYRRAAAMLGEFEALQARRNGVIDTASNYDAIAAICKDWNRGNIWPKVPPKP